MTRWSEVFRRAAVELAERGHTKGEYEYEQEGSVCALGAVTYAWLEVRGAPRAGTGRGIFDYVNGQASRAATTEFVMAPERVAVANAHVHVVLPNPIPTFNDAEDTTPEDVQLLLLLLAEAIADEEVRIDASTQLAEVLATPALPAPADPVPA